MLLLPFLYSALLYKTFHLQPTHRKDEYHLQESTPLSRDPNQYETSIQLHS